MALLQGVSSLVSLGYEPQVLLERAIGLVLEALGFEGAAVVVGGRPLLVTGKVDMKRIPSEIACERFGYTIMSKGFPSSTSRFTRRSVPW